MLPFSSSRLKLLATNNQSKRQFFPCEKASLSEDRTLAKRLFMVLNGRNSS